MATLNVSYGTRTEFGTDTNINGMTSNYTKAIGGVTNTSTLASGFKIDMTVYLPTTGVTSTGVISIYYVESADGTNYTDGINITATTDQTSSIKNAEVVKVGIANANSQIVRIMFDLKRDLPPPYFGLLLANNTGATISTTSNSAYYRPILWTIA